MANIKTYIHDSYKDKRGESAVFVETHLKGRKVRFNTGVKIKPAKFDKNNNKVTGPGSKDLNIIIENCRARVNDVIVRYKLQFRELTPEKLKEEYNKGAQSVDFIEYFRNDLEKRRGLLAHTTIKLHKSVLTKLADYKKTLPFYDVDSNFVNDYRKHLKKKYGNSNNTITKNLKVIKQYLDKAKKQQLYDGNPWDKPLRRAKTSPVYLTENEVSKLIKFYKGGTINPNQKIVLMGFLFRCFTGLRISDFKAITFDNIIANMLIYTPIKTANIKSETVKVPLIKPALQLIKESARLKVSGTIFQNYSDQVTNRILKTIAAHEDVGIDKNISTHTARHTFATLFLDKTNDVATLQKLLGHSNIRQTMVYVHISEQKKREQIKIFEKKLHFF